MFVVPIKNHDDNELAMKFLVKSITLIVLFPCQGAGQASVNVSTSDAVYRDIDKLVAFNLVDAIIVRQRPYSGSEIARIPAEAESSFAKRCFFFEMIFFSVVRNPGDHEILPPPNGARSR